MDRLVLTRPVQIAGRDFWGRRACLVLEPTQEPGWFWRVDGADVPLLPPLLARRHHCLALIYRNARLNIVEHLLALRVMTGIDCLRIVSEGSWLPYDGSAENFWHALKPALVRDGQLLPHSVVGTHATQGSRKVSIQESTAEALDLSVTIDYPDLGVASLRRSFPALGAETDQIIRTKAQGWPKRRRHLASLAAGFGWPHFSAAVWPQDHAPEHTLELFARHRLLDLAGVFAVLCPPGGLITGIVSSESAGHAQDVELVKSLAGAKALDA